MIYDTTYSNPKIKESIDLEVGTAYPLFKRFKMNGVGSGRFIIEHTSNNLSGIKNEVSDINYANMELRPKGVLIHITKGLKRYAWALPYYKLVLFYSENFSIHGEGQFLKFKKGQNFKENMGFFKKVLFYKNIYLSQN